MGCDGGTIPKRCELVPEKKKKELRDRNFSRIARWTTCQISHRKLVEPIVACRLGRIYNKESVIEHILECKSKTKDTHIRKMKDVKELKLKLNPNFKESYLTNIELQTVAQFRCPVSDLEMNGKYEFVFFWTCGCVISKRALNEIKTPSCILCNTPFSQDDIVNINPSEPDSTQSKASDSNSNPKKIKELKSSANKKKIIQKSKNVTDHKPIFKKSTLPATISINETASNPNHPYDPKTSSVYKSLFTSDAKYKNRSKDSISHWVTTFNYSV